MRTTSSVAATAVAAKPATRLAHSFPSSIKTIEAGYAATTGNKQRSSQGMIVALLT